MSWQLTRARPKSDHFPRAAIGRQLLSKCSSNSFPHTKYMSQSLENSQNHTLMFCCSLIPGRRFEKQGKLWDRFVPQFFLSILLPSLRDWRPTMYCNVVLTVFHSWWYVFCVWKIFRTTFGRIVVYQSRGDCSILWENFIDPGFESATYIFSC